ncbi:MAG: phytoene desaturase family protein, partial [Acidimicrobiales bacterium]
MNASGGLDAVVVGAGPNGLAAAITLARAGRRVLVLEAQATIGGACRSGELTEPGFVHDLCAGAHPLGVGSPFFASLPLAQLGLRWVHADLALAHPLDGPGAAVLERSVTRTALGLGRDAAVYQRLVGPLAAAWPALAPAVLGPLAPPSRAA